MIELFFAFVLGYLAHMIYPTLWSDIRAKFKKARDEAP